MDWYQRPTLLEFLETVDIRERLNQHAFRFPVQWVNRLNADFRSFLGAVVADSIRPGDKIQALPLGQIEFFDWIVLSTHYLDQAGTLTLDREIDLTQGDLIVSANAPCEVSDQFDAELVWVDNEPGYVGRRYILQLGNSQANASLSDIKFKYDVNNFQHLSGRNLFFNKKTNIKITLDAEIRFEAYADCPGLGAFAYFIKF